MTKRFTESVVEEAALEWFGDIGYAVAWGSGIAPGERDAERESYEQAVLEGRFRDALRRLNPRVAGEALDEAFRKVTHISAAHLIDANHALHAYLVKDVSVEYLRADGTVGYEPVRLVDFDAPDENDWLVVNQFTVIETGHNRRPDVVVFLNGLPLATFELKNMADESATVFDAIHQLRTYTTELPTFFAYNALLVASDGQSARLGTVSSPDKRFSPWPTIDGATLASAATPELEVLIRGVFDKRRFLDIIRYFIVFEAADDSADKKVAGYHQFHAVARAVEATLAASHPTGNRQAGVVWHTQGSGKSLTMAFYAGRIVLHPEMRNPTLVVLTDRNDLDEQLFGTFSRCHELLQQKPNQAEDRSHLRRLLEVASGGVIFTTIQKFFPESKGDRFPTFSDRGNIVVIADEAHRSQYDFLDGFARHMRDALPNATFIGFTGTPIELTDKNTRQVFGDYISIYDIKRAVADGATVPIYYESRLAKIEIDEAARPHLDAEFEEVTEGEEVESREKLKTKWSALEALVGAEQRVALVADDIVRHFESRLEALDGKALVVCMSRLIAVDLYRAIVKLRPTWHCDDEAAGEIKIVMTGSAADPVDWQPLIKNKPHREALAKRLKAPDDPLKMVIVRDMWLTGFDAPCLHTMYIDKPMQGHNLMQAIARVNRVFRDKPGGRVVDYIGLADQLRRAVEAYTESGGTGDATHDPREAVAVVLAKHETCCDIIHGFDWRRRGELTAAEKTSLFAAALDHVLKQVDGKERFLDAVAELSKAYALAAPHPDALRIRDDLLFFQEVRALLRKTTSSNRELSGELDTAVRQIISKAVSSDEVVDIFSGAGLKAPDISVLSDGFLAEVRDMKHKNLAAELLQKLLRDEVKSRARRNIVEGRSFAELLDGAVRRYQNRAIETAQFIEELINLARKMREADERGERTGLSREELAFYDALLANDSAVKVLGDKTLKAIALELLTTIRKNATIDWMVKESTRAKLRTLVKRVLRKHGYPPDRQESATKNVLAQGELLFGEYAAATT